MKKYRVNVSGYTYEVAIEELSVEDNLANHVQSINKSNMTQSTDSNNFEQKQGTQVSVSKNSKKVEAPMQGKIIGVNVSKGDMVTSGQAIAVLEAMKMENEIVASESGTVTDIRVTVGQLVDAGDALIILV